MAFGACPTCISLRALRVLTYLIFTTHEKGTIIVLVL